MCRCNIDLSLPCDLLHYGTCSYAVSSLCIHVHSFMFNKTQYMYLWIFLSIFHYVFLSNTFTSLYIWDITSLYFPLPVFPNTITSPIQPPGNKIYTHRIGSSSVYQSTVFRDEHMYTIPHSPFISIPLISHIVSCLSSSIILAPIPLLGTLFAPFSFHSTSTRFALPVSRTHMIFHPISHCILSCDISQSAS